MDDRKKALFSAIIKEHTGNGCAVGSKMLVDKYHLDVSPATVRNDMMALEEEGLLTHQYTSSGRIPTEKGWKYYLEHVMSAIQLVEEEKNALTQAHSDPNNDMEVRLKRIAKTLAELSREAVIVAFSPDDVYYTGISHLFAQPEFRHLDFVSRFSEVIDHLDDVVSRLFPSIESAVRVSIGSDNPFDPNCGTVLMKYQTDNREGMMGILGPMRMDYPTNIGRMRFIQEMLAT